MPRLLVLLLLVAFSSSRCLATEPRPLLRLPGVQDDGAVLLPSQWSLRPAGKQIEVGDFPVNMVLHPSGKWLALLCAGYREHEVVVIEIASRQVVSRTIVPQAFYGLAFDGPGERIFASGGEFERVHAWKFADGLLSEPRILKVGEVTQKFVPGGMAVTPNGERLVVACPWGATYATFDLNQPEPVAKHVKLPAKSFPYTVLLDSDTHGYVSLWGAASVVEVDFAAGKVLRTFDVDLHPTEMRLTPGGQHLLVACANSNSVHVVELASGRSVEVITSALYPDAPAGSTPCSLDLSADGKVLLVANANVNSVSVFDVSEIGESRSLGFVPVGWYPTSVRFAADGSLLVANGKGIWPSANRHGPRPTNGNLPPLSEYIGRLMNGTVSVIAAPSPEQLARLTKRTYACSPLLDGAAVRSSTRSEGNAIPAKVGDASPIKHCFYIIKENRTYDQIFGDMPEGNGDRNLCIFPEQVTPNHHALAREFVLLDNFYVESEVSADGHEWTMAAYASDFVEKVWPLNYRGGGFEKLGYPSEGKYTIATPKGGYLWDRCIERNVSYFTFGEWIINGEKPWDQGIPRVKALEGRYDPDFRGYDLEVSDQTRADRFIARLQQFEEEGNLPQMIVIRLPNDHTYGTREGKPTPTAMVADNDLALGRVIEAITHSKCWPQSAVFVVEDDAQNGSDHVDAHRTVALAISPYTRRHTVDSSMYSTSSMLRTMELILGLEPMSQFDAAALPMYASFGSEPDVTPYTHLPAGHDLQEKNVAGAWGAKESAAMNLATEDAADDLLFGDIVWRSVRGADSPMPPPVRAGFVFASADEEEDEHEADEER